MGLARNRRTGTAPTTTYPRAQVHDSPRSRAETRTPRQFRNGRQSPVAVTRETGRTPTRDVIQHVEERRLRRAVEVPGIAQ